MSLRLENCQMLEQERYRRSQVGRNPGMQMKTSIPSSQCQHLLQVGECSRGLVRTLTGQGTVSGALRVLAGHLGTTDEWERSIGCLTAHVWACVGTRQLGSWDPDVIHGLRVGRHCSGWDK